MEVKKGIKTANINANVKQISKNDFTTCELITTW